MQSMWRLGFALGLGFLTTSDVGQAAEKTSKPKRLLLVTDSGGFIHNSVGVAEQVLKQIGPEHGIEVTCYRFTRNPDQKSTVTRKEGGKDVTVQTTELEKYSEAFRKVTGLPVEKENCGRVNADTLKQFDAVLFFTTGNPLDESEVKALGSWVQAGGAFAATHCGSDTLYPSKERPWNRAYGEMVGGYFDGHPWHQKIKLVVEDPKHPAARGFETGSEITEEIYQFRTDVYNRNRLHVILSVDNSSIDVSKGKRADQDYAVSWCQSIGKGRSFFTSLGHGKEVWKDPRYQAHLLGGLKWAMGQAEGSSVPSAQLKGVH